jgi:hypothetical protein
MEKVFIAAGVIFISIFYLYVTTKILQLLKVPLLGIVLSFTMISMGLLGSKILNNIISIYDLYVLNRLGESGIRNLVVNISYQLGLFFSIEVLLIAIAYFYSKYVSPLKQESNIQRAIMLGAIILGLTILIAESFSNLPLNKLLFGVPKTF